MGYTVESGIEIPRTRGRNRIYPFGDMKVGDSFFAADVHANSIRSSASFFGSRNNAKFTVRKDGSGYRCWRIA